MRSSRDTATHYGTVNQKRKKQRVPTVINEIQIKGNRK